MSNKRIDKDMKTNELTGDQLSALIDGELASREQPLLLARICADQESQARFGRYSLIGDAMRAGRGDMLAVGLAGRVSAELDAVEAHRGGPGIGYQRLTRPLIGIAVAAGVAALAVINLPGAGVLLESDSPGIASVENSSYIVPPNLAPVNIEPQVTARLTNYLIEHSEFSPSPVRRNVLYEIIGQEDATAALENQAGSATDSEDESLSQ
jgi:hypothetical protein